MTLTRHVTLLGAGLLLGTALAAHAAGMVTDAKGMTLYIFDKDSGGVPSCYDACAVKWPPYLGEAEASMTEGWTLVNRSDGSKQWAYDGKPMYYYAGDKKTGDATGNGIGGIWHIVTE